MRPQKWIAIILVLVLVHASSSSWGQTEQVVKRNIAIVLFSSLGGAVLGLSTLSFYGDPEEHTNNIGVGALVGLLGGVGYVTYQSSQPQPVRYEYSQNLGMDFGHRRGTVKPSNKTVPLFKYSFTF